MVARTESGDDVRARNQLALGDRLADGSLVGMCVAGAAIGTAYVDGVLIHFGVQDPGYQYEVESGLYRAFAVGKATIISKSAGKRLRPGMET